MCVLAGGGGGDNSKKKHRERKRGQVLKHDLPHDQELRSSEIRVKISGETLLFQISETVTGF